MKIGIYNEPCGGGLGGSEVSVAVLAEALAKDHEVEILHERPAMTRESLSRFAGVLHKVSLKIRPPQPPSHSIWNRYLTERRAEVDLSGAYDLFITFAHSVPPYCAAPNSALMVLFPLLDFNGDSATAGNHWIPKPLLSIWRKRKWTSSLNSYKIKAANSDFTRRWTKKRWDIDCHVIFPPVDISVQPGEKADHILSVGRFAVSGHGKKQAEMIQMFNQLKTSGNSAWNYDCVGGCGASESETAFLQTVTRLGNRCGAKVIANLGHEELRHLYRRARIFWHAAGMDIDENLHPELTEHFGMTTVEAMAAGCVPVVINKGGQPEIVEHGVSGFLWNTSEECLDYTARLMRDDVLLKKMSKAARERAGLFSREAYVKRFRSLLSLGENGQRHV